MGRVPGIGLLFDATDVLTEGDRKIKKTLVTAAEQNSDSNRRFHIMHFRILICNIRNYKPLREICNKLIILYKYFGEFREYLILLTEVQYFWTQY